MTPHKHAALIKAWADGAVIQARFPGIEEWKDIDPTWSLHIEYRIKPEPVMVKYRRYVAKTLGGKLRVFTYCDGACHSIESVERQIGFAKWIDHDWITEEV